MSLVQTRALSNNNSAMGRSMAVVASYSILEAMRADRANAVATALPYNATVTASNCPTNTSNFANVQLGAWCAELRSRFSAVDTTTGNVNCNTAGICTITIQFDDSRGGVGLGNTATVITRAAL
ncbi:MAG: type IV pilus modification protein PilV [Proteobacteria bacterium]|nr:type IV pilus modification protein PilV [Pseudomonadota bacterium]